MKQRGTPRGMERFRTLSQDEFAARCRAARGYADMNIGEVADLIGISRQALSRREKGWVNIQVPDRFVMAQVLCEVTGWPEEVFTSEAWPVVPSPAEVEVEPEDVAGLVGESQDDAAQG